MEEETNKENIKQEKQKRVGKKKRIKKRKGWKGVGKSYEFKDANYGA